MALFKKEEKQKNPKKLKKAEALAALAAGDRDFAPAPAESGESEFEKLLQASFSETEFKAGEIVKGKVVAVKNDYISVDISYKSEGLVPKSEFHLLKGESGIEPGQEIEVYIDRIEDERGMVALSKDKADIKRAWREITAAAENNETVEGKVLSMVKGGLSVDIGVKAFAPGSQMDIHPIRNLEAYVGNTYDFKVIKVNHKRGNIVLSRRAILEKEGRGLPNNLENLKEGAVVRGIVKNLTEYGAFVDLGGIDGLLHVTDMSWSRVDRPSDILKVGQEIDVKILKCDPEKNRIGLGVKQLDESKWEEAASRYETGSTVTGRVSSLVDYGAFVTLEEGLEGLVHINELSWTRKVKNPAQVLRPGEEIKVKVIGIQKESHKISLSVKQTKESPWIKIMEKYSVGQVMELPIVSISDFGLFVKIDEDIDGLIHVSDLSWTENINPFEKYRPGDIVKAKVLDINPRDEKFSLGIKHLQENPWDTVEEKFPIGSRHEVEVVHIVDFGVFVRIQKDIEGLIHISELSRTRVKHPEEVARTGDKLMAEIISIDKDSKKIGLSRRLLELERAGAPRKPDGDSPAEKAGGFMESIFAKALKKSIKGGEKSAPAPAAAEEKEKTAAGEGEALKEPGKAQEEPSAEEDPPKEARRETEAPAPLEEPSSGESAHKEAAEKEAPAAGGEKTLKKDS